MVFRNVSKCVPGISSLFVQNRAALTCAVRYPVWKKLSLVGSTRSFALQASAYQEGHHKHQSGFSKKHFLPLFFLPFAYCKDQEDYKNSLSNIIKGASGGGCRDVDCSESCLKLLKLLRTRNLNNIGTHLKNETTPDALNVCRHAFGWTPLMVAAVNGNFELLKVLLDAGSDPNIQDNYFSSKISHPGLTKTEIQILREHEFSEMLNPRKDFRGYTALHYAVLNGSEKCVQLLLERGADPLIKNFSGHLSEAYANPEQTSLLKLLKACKEKALAKKEENEAKERARHPLEQQLKVNIIGQECAIVTVAAAIRRKQNGWFNDNHPLVFLFLGSSGIGKTELAKQLASYLHQGDKKAFIRLDMSEYQEKHEVAKLIGSPPGYVGHDQGGQLTKKLREQPKSVVLFDEVDKAHPDVLTVLLQLFDEGRLTDGKGQTLECKDAVFIMTSNLAASEIADYGQKLRKLTSNNVNSMSEESKTEDEDKSVGLTKVSRIFQEQVVRPILRRHFGRDEFLGRINEFVYFLPFSYPELLQLVEKELKMWAGHAKQKHNIKFSWQDPEVTALLARGYNVHYGGRSLKYEVDRRVITLLAHAQEQGFLKRGCSVHVKVITDGKEDEQLQLDITGIEDEKEKKSFLNENQLLNWQLKGVPNPA